MRRVALFVCLGTILPGVVLTGRAADPGPEVIEPAISAGDLQHWAFRPVVRPEPPGVNDGEWCRNPIDRFLLARLEAEGLHPTPPADRETLIRRVTFDLTGLPPAAADIEQFLADDTPEAWSRLIDRLLASTAYGERWAQHWLDLARFAETDGFEHDLERPHAWRFRDWVIGALNADVPYDQFVSLQLAGDELQPGDPAASIATGFLLCGPDMPDLNLQEERRHNFLNDLTGTVGAVLLGLQVGCAACHDHKYDPISQFDFYRLRACFDPMEIFRDHPLPAGEGEGTDARLLGRVVRESTPEAAPSHLYHRGDFRRPGPAVVPAGLRVASNSRELLATPVAGATTSQRRTRLARWICDFNNPLTTRVLVNRVWQQHFGRGLVETPSDFGKFGADPTHGELLDWLATEFVRDGWSLKNLHRLILNSAAWQQASRLPDSEDLAPANPKSAELWRLGLERDPANKWFSRFSRRRLDGEEIRDALLAVSGGLSHERGGPGVRPPLPPEIVQTLLANQWKPSASLEEQSRRSIYLFVRRNLRYPLFEAFDRPDTNASCPQRNRSTIAPQSLVMLNSDLTLTSAKGAAAVVLEQVGGEIEQRAAGAVRQILRRRARPSDVELAAEFLQRESQRLRAQTTPHSELPLPDPLPRDSDRFEAAALVELCLALINVSEFQYLD